MDNRSPTPQPHPDANNRGRPHVEYDRRLPPPIDLDQLSRNTALVGLRDTPDFITIVRNASLEDPIARSTEVTLAQL